jgi:hypothetical protein
MSGIFQGVVTMRGKELFSSFKCTEPPPVQWIQESSFVGCKAARERS